MNETAGLPSISAPIIDTTLIPVIHCALHLMILSIDGLYPSHLIIIHNSNCDNRAIPHLLSISIPIRRDLLSLVVVVRTMYYGDSQ
jgi:hypothetical protein